MFCDYLLQTQITHLTGLPQHGRTWDRVEARIKEMNQGMPDDMIIKYHLRRNAHGPFDIQVYAYNLHPTFKQYIKYCEQLAARGVTKCKLSTI